MTDLIFALNATVPIFIIMVFGYIIKRIGLISSEFVRGADRFVFKISLPLLLFKDIAEMDFKTEFNPYFVIFCIIGTTVMFISVWSITLIATKNRCFAGSFAQASARGSAAILGVAFITNIYGNSETAAMMIVAAVPLYNIYSVIMLTYGETEERFSAKTVKEIFKRILTNPIIIGIIAGLPFSILNITLPEIILKPIDSIAAVTTPLALIVIGADFSFRLAKSKITPAIIATALKLFVFPAVILTPAILLGFRESNLVALLIMSGSPTTVSAVIMANNMHGDSVLTADTVVLSTLFSAFSLSMWLFILKYFCLI